MDSTLAIGTGIGVVCNYPGFEDVCGPDISMQACILVYMYNGQPLVLAGQEL